MKTKRFGLPVLLLAAAATLFATLGGVVLAAFLFIGPEGMTLLEGLALIHTRFVGEYETADVVDSAMYGMVAGLEDRWSYYLTPERYAATREQRQNVYTGIGVTVSYESEDGLLLATVNPDGPADRAGLRAGEYILSVDGISLAGEERYNGSSLIHGEAGTRVTLEVRAVDGTVRTVEVTRKKLETDPVSYQLLDSGVGYIIVKNFYERSADGVKAAVDDLISQGAISLVFDMRNNGGGYLSELTDMLDYLLPEGVIFRQQDRSGREYATSSDAQCVNLPMATLVNKDTYSAAEFFGAELQEWGVGVIVGEKTSGKGYSQQTYPLPGGGAMGISTQKYFTGGGVSLIGTGVTLDAERSLSDEDNALLQAGKLPTEEDEQLQAALALLKQNG